MTLSSSSSCHRESNPMAYTNSSAATQPTCSSSGAPKPVAFASSSSSSSGRGNRRIAAMPDSWDSSGRERMGKSAPCSKHCCQLTFPRHMHTRENVGLRATGLFDRFDYVIVSPPCADVACPMQQSEQLGLRIVRFAVPCLFHLNRLSKISSVCTAPLSTAISTYLTRHAPRLQ